MNQKLSIENVGSKLSCPTLKGKDNYHVWAFTIFEHLKTINLEGFLTIKGNVEEEENKGRVDDVEKSQQVKSFLISTMIDDEISKIMHCNTASQIWSYFKQMYDSKSSNVKLELMNELSNMKFASAKEVVDGLNKILAIRGKLANLKVTIDDVTIIDVIIKALPSSFKMFLANWKMIDCESQTLDRLMIKLNEKAKEVEEDELVEQLAFKAVVNPRDGRGINRIVGYGSKVPQNRGLGGAPRLFLRRNLPYKQNRYPNQDIRVSRSSSGTTENVCNYCKNKGHWKRDCRKLKFKEANKNIEEIAFPAIEKKTSNLHRSFFRTQDPIWIVDSGCSAHMTPNREWINDLVKPSTTIKVRIGDGRLLLVEGMGNVYTNCGTLRVYYVPTLGANLFSVPSAMKTYDKITFRNQVIEIEREGQLIATGFVKHGMCLLELKLVEPVALTATTIENWHMRFGHLPKSLITRMSKNNIVNGIEFNEIDNHKCVDCVLNKCRRVSHPLRSSTKATKPGIVLHADLVGPIRPEGLRNERFILVCKDEFSKMVITACLSEKSRTPEVLKVIITRCELQTRNSMLRLVTDNGSEFVNNRMTTFLQNRGIDHIFSAPYVHQQNGLVERENQTILNMSRTILNASKLSKRLWPEAISVATYVSNRAIKKDTNITPYELWYNKKPNIGNLKIFGEQASVFKTDHRGKFDSKGEVMNFVGYTEYYNTFKFVNPLTLDFKISCDAVFLNEVGPRTNANTSLESPAIGSNTNYVFDFSNNPGENIEISDEEVDVENVIREIDDTLETLRSCNAERNLDETVDKNTTLSTTLNLPEKCSLPPSTQVDIGQNVLEKSSPQQSTETSTLMPSPSSSSTLQRSRSTEELRPKRTVNKIDYKLLSTKGVKNLNANLAIENVKTSADEERTCPNTYNEAMDSDDSDLWRKAFEHEMQALISKNVFEVVQKPECTNIVGSRWVLSYKRMADGGIKPKARLVAKGYSQKYGVDFLSTFAPVVDMTSVRFLFALIATMNLKFLQFDVKTAFLNGDLEEDIFMSPPEGYEINANKVWKLKKSLYGLRQSPRKWNEKITHVLRKIGFIQLSDNCMFRKHSPFVILAVYVDDAILCAHDLQTCNEVIDQLKNEFEIQIVKTNKFLGFQYKQLDNGSMMIHQEDYVRKLINKFGMTFAKTAPTPFEVGQNVEGEHLLEDNTEFRELIGCLQFAACQTRIDIAFTVNYLSRNVLKPSNIHMQIAKRTLKYLNGTLERGIVYKSNGSNELCAYSDADYAGDHSNYKSTSGQILMLADGPIGWRSKLQKMNVTSTTEAEYLALSSTVKSVLIVRNLAKDLDLDCSYPTKIFSDNRGAVSIATNEASAQRTRHLGAQLFFVKDQQDRKNVDINWVPSSEQLADALTKPLNREKFSSNILKLMFSVLCLISLVSAQNTTNQIKFVKVNPIIWTNMGKSVNIGLHTHKHTIKIPDYCQEIKQKKQKLQNNTLGQMLERVENSCYALRRDIYLPNIKNLEGYKFKIERFPRDTAKNQTLLSELEKISKEDPREAAGGWETAGASVPLIGTFIQTLTQYNQEDSAYNTVWKHDKEIKTITKQIVNQNQQFTQQVAINSNATKAINELNHATNVIFGDIDMIKKASPEVSDLVSKVTVNTYRDADLMRDLKSGFDRGELNVDALMKLGHPGTEINKTVSLAKAPVARMTNFRIDWKAQQMTFIYNYPIIDPNSFIYETTNMKEYVTENIYRIFPVNLYAIYNSTNNCSKLISRPTEQKEIIGVHCREENFQFEMPRTPYRLVHVEKNSEESDPQIIKKNYEIYIQCFKHNITTEGIITQPCPKYPFMVPIDFSYQIEGWIHNYENEHSTIDRTKLDLDELEDIEQLYPWSNTFEYVQNRLKDMENSNEEIEKLSKMEMKKETSYWKKLEDSIYDLLHEDPILCFCFILFLVVGLAALTFLCYLNLKGDPFLQLAEATLLASAMSNVRPTNSSSVQDSPPPYDNHRSKEPDAQSININITNQAYPDLGLNHTDLRNMFLDKQYKDDNNFNPDHNKRFQDIDDSQEPDDLKLDLLDKLSFRSLPIIEETSEPEN